MLCLEPTAKNSPTPIWGEHLDLVDPDHDDPVSFYILHEPSTAKHFGLTAGHFSGQCLAARTIRAVYSVRRSSHNRFSS